MHEREARPSRREVVVRASAAAILAGLPVAEGASAQENDWRAAVDQVLAGATPRNGKLLIELPEIAENGNTVPFTAGLDSPMSAADYVKTLHIFATGNPQPLISTFHFTPQSGKAVVAGRLRLAKSQQIVALAALSDGRFVMERRDIKVTIGGCGG